MQHVTRRGCNCLKFKTSRWIRTQVLKKIFSLKKLFFKIILILRTFFCLNSWQFGISEMRGGSCFRCSFIKSSKQSPIIFWSSRGLQGKQRWRRYCVINDKARLPVEQVLLVFATVRIFWNLKSRIFTSRRKCRAAGRRRSCLASSETRCYSSEGFSKEPFPCFQCTGLIQFLRF